MVGVEAVGRIHGLAGGDADAEPPADVRDAPEGVDGFEAAGTDFVAADAAGAANDPEAGRGNDVVGEVGPALRFADADDAAAELDEAKGLISADAADPPAESEEFGTVGRLNPAECFIAAAVLGAAGAAGELGAAKGVVAEAAEGVDAAGEVAPAEGFIAAAVLGAAGEAGELGAAKGVVAEAADAVDAVDAAEGFTAAAVLDAAGAAGELCAADGFNASDSVERAREADDIDAAGEGDAGEGADEAGAAKGFDAVDGVAAADGIEPAPATAPDIPDVA